MPSLSEHELLTEIERIAHALPGVTNTGTSVSLLAERGYVRVAIDVNPYSPSLACYADSRLGALRALRQALLELRVAIDVLELRGQQAADEMVSGAYRAGTSAARSGPVVREDVRGNVVAFDRRAAGRSH